MKQYLPKKPVKRGFKVWVRADAQTGFFCDFQIYTGKLADGEGVEHGLGERVVLQLSQNIEGRNHQVFCDNFFTTCGLLETLLEKGIYGCGTTKPSRRGFPEDLKKLHLQRGEHAFRQRGNLVATVWKDKKDVTLLSTMTSPDSVTTVQRRQRDGTITDVACPEVVPVYNRYMSGVDKGDQLRGYYRVRLKCMKYYKYIFWFLFDIDVSITNAFILSSYVPTTTSKHTLKKFRLMLATQLIGNYNSRRRAGRPSSNATSHPPPPLPPADDAFS